MALLLVKTDSKTVWLSLWKFNPHTAKWVKITRYPVPYEPLDTRFRQAVIKMHDNGLVFYPKDKTPINSKAFKIGRSLIDEILANPPIFLEAQKIDFDSYWREKEQKEMRKKIRIRDKALQKYKEAYDRGEILPRRVLRLLGVDK
jgi:hypothetical protein